MATTKNILKTISLWSAAALCGNALEAQASTPAKPPAKGDVYVAGYEVDSESCRVAMLWKNGVGQALTNGENKAEAFSVYVSGDDVYVAGYEDDTDGKMFAMLWKNGVGQALTESDNWAQAHSVFVSGNDVYVAGFALNDKTNKKVNGDEDDDDDRLVAMLWKNGVGQVLSDDIPEDGIARWSVYVTGKDVYVAGNDGFKATLWKNGKGQTLQNEGLAKHVFVSGKDVYVAGFAVGYKADKKVDKKVLKKSNRRTNEEDDEPDYDEYGNDENDQSLTAMLWKNGVGQALAIEKDPFGMFITTQANSVFVSGKDVYVAGQLADGEKDGEDDDETEPLAFSRAMLWKNGKGQELSNTECDRYYLAEGNSVFVSGKDVYVAGTVTCESKRVAMLWKNGVGQALSSGKKSSSAYSVFVK